MVLCTCTRTPSRQRTAPFITTLDLSTPYHNAPAGPESPLPFACSCPAISVHSLAVGRLLVPRLEAI